jgi:hypothetical protein
VDEGSSPGGGRRPGGADGGVWRCEAADAWRWEAAGRCTRLEVGGGRKVRTAASGGARRWRGGRRLEVGGSREVHTGSGEVGKKVEGMGLSGSARAWERKK